MNKNKYEWYCDNCDAHLNHQSGFTNESGSWKCDVCGWLNDVSKKNVLSKEMQSFAEMAYVTCPFCNAHMIEVGKNNWTCNDCGCTGVFDYEADKLLVVKYPCKK